MKQKRKTKRAKRTRRSGFVLLMVLLVLTIAGVVMASASRLSCQKAVRAGVALEELQLRWGVRSCRDVCLASPQVLLADMGDLSEGRPAVTMRHSVTLNGMKYRLLLFDEQCKANVNQLVARKSLDGLRRSLIWLQGGLAGALAVRLEPTRPLIYFAGYDQLFNYRHPRELICPENPEAGATARITCWGDGKLNFKCAEDDVLSLMLEGVLKSADQQKLIKFQRRNPDCTLDEAIDELELSAEKLTDVEALLTDESDCYSLWVIVEGPTRKWHRLFIRQEMQAATPLDRGFVWP